MIMLNNYIVYTDGAYSSSRKQGGTGLVFIKDDKVILKHNAMYKDTTNNRMEIQAVINAFKCIRKPIDSLTIYSDSMYVIGCATMGWKREKNSDLWEIYQKEYDKVSKLCSKIEFIHVKGHNGDKYNEIVDKLAVEASQFNE